jgi:hypothetical protein
MYIVYSFNNNHTHTHTQLFQAEIGGNVGKGYWDNERKELRVTIAGVLKEYVPYTFSFDVINPPYGQVLYTQFTCFTSTKVQMLTGEELINTSNVISGSTSAQPHMLTYADFCRIGLQSMSGHRTTQLDSVLSVYLLY